MNPVLALMLLAFTMTHMVRSAHLALSPIHFTAKFDFAISDRYSYEKMHIASLVRRDGLISALVTTLTVVTCAEMSSSRLHNDAVCI